MKRILIALLAAAATAVSAQPVESFPRLLTVTQEGKDGLQRLVLPPAVHLGAARADLGDLRVFNARGEKVPFAFAGQPQRSDAAPREYSLPLFPLVGPARASQDGLAPLNLQVRQQADGTLISLSSGGAKATTQRAVTGYIADASKVEGPIAALSFDWAVTPDSQTGRVSIEGSDDLKAWTPIASSVALLDLEHGGHRLTQKRVSVAPTGARYLRFTWQGTAFDVKQVRAENPASVIAPVYEQATVPGSAGEAAGEVVFDLGGRLPVERVNLLLPEANSVVPVRIFARSDTQQPWLPVVSGTFYRLTRDGAELTPPPLAVAVTTERYWKIAVDQRGGGLGTALPRLAVDWQPRSIVFAARGEGPYRVAFGNATATPASFALPQLVPDYRSNSEYSLPLAKAGMVVVQEVKVPGAMQKIVDDLNAKQVVLWLVLLAGVGFLGMMAWRLNAQVGKGAPPTA